MNGLTMTLSQVADGGVFTDGDWVESKDQDPAGLVRLTQLADVGVAEFRDRSDRWLREDQAARLGCTFLQPNDILIARMPDPIGRACLVPKDIGRAVTVVDVAVLRVDRADVLPEYVVWAINAPQFHMRVVALMSGTTRKRISRRNLATLEIPIPDVREQRRIVEILEDHLSRLDAANSYLVATTRRAQAMLTSQLSRARGGEARALADLADIQGGIQKQQRRTPRDNAYPFLRVANVTAVGLDLREVHRIELFGEELERLRLQRGDLLVVEGNGSPSQIGRAALWDGSIADCVHQNHLIRVRPKDGLLPAYLEAVWNSPENRAVLTAVSSSSSGLHTLSVSKLRQITIPVPSLEEQEARAVAVATAREAVGRLSGELVATKTRADRLRRAVLAAAFSGKLTGRRTDEEVIEELASV